MTRSLSRVLLSVVVAFAFFMLAQTPAQAQYRRPIVVPPVRTYVNSNPYVLPGVTYRQYATLGALNPGYFPPTVYGYYNPYRTAYVPYVYPGFTYPSMVGVPAAAVTPYRYYNPYFASFGFYP